MREFIWKFKKNAYHDTRKDIVLNSSHLAPLFLTVLWDSLFYSHFIDETSVREAGSSQS